MILRDLKRVLLLLTVFPLVFPTSSLAAQSDRSPEIKIARMKTKLSPVAAQRRTQRLISATSITAIGVTTGVLGLAVPNLESSGRIALVAVGGLFAGLGVLEFFLPTLAESTLSGFAQVEADSSLTSIQRVERMEASFEELSRTLRRSRLVSAGLNAVSGAIFLGGGIGLLASGSGSYYSDASRAMGGVFLGCGLGVGVASLVGFLVETPEEDAWNSYRSWLSDGSLASRGGTWIDVQPLVAARSFGLSASLHF